MSKYEEIKSRYLAGYVTEAQLDRYVTLSVITEAQAAELRAEKNGEGPTTEEMTEALETLGVNINE